MAQTKDLKNKILKDFEALWPELAIETKGFLSAALDKLEAQVVGEIREKVEKSWTDFDGQCDGEACRLYRKILSLLPTPQEENK